MAKSLPEHQSLRAKKAEAGRPFHGSSVLTDPEVSSTFRRRADTARADLERLARQGVHLGPFLEIGAGSTQRSAVLANDCSADGVATDISQGSLRDAPYVLSLPCYDRSPMLICCDAHHLPFLESTFRFVFCYQTLHHFDNPCPVVAECYRVLGRGGHLFLNEEPMDSPLKRLLRGRRHLSHPLTRMQRLAKSLGVESLFWDDSALELSLGMTEARFDIELWREALKPFGQVSVEISRKLGIRSDLYRPLLAALVSGMWGGNVSASAAKTVEVLWWVASASASCVLIAVPLCFPTLGKSD